MKKASTRALTGTILATALCAGAIAAAPASAGLFDGLRSVQIGDLKLYETHDSNYTCDRSQMSTPFERLGDDRTYIRAPGGSFESWHPGWQLDGGADRTGYFGQSKVHTRWDDGALRMEPGSSVISPVMCIDLDYPHFRFLARTADHADSTISVEVIYPDAAEPAFSERLTFGADEGVNAKRDWTLGRDVALEPERFDAAPGARRVAFRITVEGDSPVLLDEIQIDPRNRV